MEFPIALFFKSVTFFVLAISKNTWGISKENTCLVLYFNWNVGPEVEQADWLIFVIGLVTILVVY